MFTSRDTHEISREAPVIMADKQAAPVSTAEQKEGALAKTKSDLVTNTMNKEVDLFRDTYVRYLGE